MRVPWRRWTATFCIIGSGTLGCTDSCACGEGGGEDEPAHAARVAPGLKGSAGTVARVLRDDAGVPVPPVESARFDALPEGPVREQLEALSAKIDWDQRLGAVVTASSVRPVLKDRVAGFTSVAKPIESTARIDGAPATVVERNYKNGERAVRVKITDTAEVPALRQSVLERLLVVTGDVSGNQHGTIVSGFPGVTSFRADVRISRSAVLAHGRFLVEVMVENTDEADDSIKAIEALDLKALAPK